MKRKGKATFSAKKGKAPVTSTIHEVPQFQPLFRDLFVGATYEYVDPFACIPFTKIRDTSDAGVKKLIDLFDRKAAEATDHDAPGFAFGTDTPCIVPLSGTLSHHVYSYFQDLGCSDCDVQEKVNGRAEWFGIVDGLHSNKAMRWMLTNREDWKNISWFVTKLKGGFPVERYRQLARFQNHRHSPKYYVSLTFYDEVYNLRTEYNRLSAQSQAVSNVSVARTYFGQEQVSRTMTMLASTAVRLPQRTIETLGAIMNSEHPDLLDFKKQDHGPKSSTSCISIGNDDCRVFRQFVKLHSIYNCSPFMNVKTEDDIEAQVNTLFRVRDVCKSIGFRTVQHQDVLKQYKLSVCALQEERKFLSYMSSKQWPPNMEVIRTNLLRSTTLDSELMYNTGNNHDVLPSILTLLKRLDPNLAQQCEESIKIRKTPQPAIPQNDTGNLENCEITSSDPNKSIDEDKDDSDEDFDTSSDHSEPSSPTRSEAKNTQLTSVTGPSPPLEDSVDCNDRLIKLKAVGVSCFNSTWQDYNTTSRTSDSSHFDLILTEPPPIANKMFNRSCRSGSTHQPEIEDKELSEFPRFVKSVLKPTGYAIIILPFYSYLTWYDLFDKSGFELMPHPYVFTFSSDSIQKRNPKVFPQNASLFGLIAHLPGRSDFSNKNFNTDFNLVNCSNSRNCAAMFNIMATKSKLCKPSSRIPFHVNELPFDMLAELVDLLTPNGGNVLDPYSGSMSVAVACMNVGRQCVCIERNSDCFEAALDRLTRFILPPAKKTRIEEECSSGVKCLTDVQLEQYQILNQPEDMSATDNELSSCHQIQSAHDSNEPIENDCHTQEKGLESRLTSSFPRKEIFSVTETDNKADAALKSQSISHPVSAPSDNLSITPDLSSTQRLSTRKRIIASVSRGKLKRNKMTFSPDQTIQLMVGNISVGKAVLKEGQKGQLCRRLHGQELIGTNGQDLVVVKGVQISPRRNRLPYPYHCPGPEGSPSALKDLYRAGLYVWDLNKTKEVI